MSTGGKKAVGQYLSITEKKIGKRIHQFLTKYWENAAFDFGEQSPYEESLLSRELRNYFTELAEEVLPDEEVGDGFLGHIYSVFNLDEFEQMCVELALLAEINGWFEKFFIYMNNDWNNGHMTMETAVGLYTLDLGKNAEFCLYFSEGSKLMKYFLRADRQPGKTRARWGLHCRDSLFQLIFSEEIPFSNLSFLIRWQAADCADGVNRDAPEFSILDIMQEQKVLAVYLCGKAGLGKKSLLGKYAQKSGHDICFLSVPRLAFLLEKNLPEISLPDLCQDILLCLLANEAWLCLHGLDGGFWEKENNRQLTFFLLDRFRNPAVNLYISGERIADIARQNPWVWELEVDDMLPVDMLEKAVCRYPVENREDLEIFASSYSFGSVQMRRVLEHADRLRILRGAGAINRKDLKESCIRETCCNDSHLVTIRDTGGDWDDLVLPERQKKQLQAACSRVLYKDKIYSEWGFDKKVAYGRGVSMVFSGAPGTGKTMAAGIVANYLGTALYRVDLAAVVSKYIGETEKNLNTVFELVRKGQGVLFFDEADVLFSKRTEVGNSNDKHSNMEAAYLLQKMEEYEGVVVLATNYMQNMDEAFKRRIQFVVDFPLPDEAHRKLLWEKAFPEQMEFSGDIDIDFLASSFELSGSHIKSIALQAAFFAADRKEGVDMGHIIRALLWEVRKTGKRITREDLKEYYIYYE